ncbi:MAG: transporter substrate-binding domain-containing protein [Alphaproteobacteria bacterium]|nr:transporter substrate-binding domain-containing protein [Alphaproteobacteria bacterium]
MKIIAGSLLRSLAMCSTLLITTATAQADTIVLKSDLWCPYNCEPDSELPGYMIEVAQEALGMFGHTVVYEKLNWLRSVEKARHGEIDGVIGAVEEEVEGFVLGPPLGPLVDGIVTRIGEELDLSQAEPLEGLTLGGINGYEYVGPLGDYIEKYRDNHNLVQFVSGDNALDMNLQKLIAGRIDVVAEDYQVILYRLRAGDLADKFTVVHNEQPDPGYIAFSPKNPNSELYAKQLEEGLNELRASGRLAEIMAKYSLPVWN